MSLKEKLTVSSAPHVRDGENTQGLMLDVIIALLPALGAGIYFFGYRAGVLAAIAVLSAILLEWLYCKVFDRTSTVWDLSAVVAGLILALNLPVTVPLWIPVVGSFFAIVFVKMLFGGLGQNFMNPAAAGRAFLMAAWPAIMTTWVYPMQKLNLVSNPDVISAATPLAIAKGGMDLAGVKLPQYVDLYMGNVPGCIGEVSSIAILLGGMYLLFRRVISWEIPTVYIATVAILIAIFGGDPLYHVLSGGLLFGAVFMATDYVTSPVTPVGKWIFGIGLGGLTVLIRLRGGYPEGVCYSILLMNVAAPLIDKWTAPRRFGRRRA